MEEEKSILVLNGENWQKWRSIMVIKFKQLDAYDWIKEEITAASLKNNPTELAKYKKAALAVGLLLLRTTNGDDNELVRNQDCEVDISSAWTKLVSKYEGDKSQRLLRTFDDMVLERFGGLEQAAVYVGRYENWAKMIENNTTSVSELVKTIVVTNIFRSLPSEFDPVKQKVREELSNYTLEKIASAIVIRARELINDKKYEEQFGSLRKPDDEEDEIDKLNAQINQVQFGANQRSNNWHNQSSKQYDQQYGYGRGRGSYNFYRPKGRGRGQQRGGGSGRGSWHVGEYANRLNQISSQDDEVSTEVLDNEDRSATTQVKPKRVIASISALVTAEPKPKKIIGYLGAMSSENQVGETNQTMIEMSAEESKPNETTVEAADEKIELLSEKQKEMTEEEPRPKRIVGYLSEIQTQRSKCDESTIIVDSGSTEYAFKNKNLMKNYKDRKGENEYVKLANGLDERVEGVGVVALTSNRHTITMRQVLHVPTLQANFMSVKKLTEAGMSVLFEDDYCAIRYKGKDLLYAEWASYGYSLLYRNGKTKKRSTFAQDQEKENQKMISNLRMSHEEELYAEWHDRLGHPGMETQNCIMRMMDLPVIKKFQCESCIKAKQARASHPASETYTERPFQRVHSDLLGPVKHKGSDLYVLSIKDDFSRHTNIYFLKHKSAKEVKKHLSNYIEYNKNRTGNKLAEFKSDNGLEFMNDELGEFLRSNNIKHLSSCTYTPQQNGKAETFNKQLECIARAILFHSGASDKYLIDALIYANSIHNILPKKTLDLKCPEELFLGRAPKYSSFHPFLCKVFVKKPNPVGKFSSRSIEAVNLGPLPYGKGHRYEELESKKRGESCNTIFIDKLYPLREKKTKPQQKKQEESEVYMRAEEPIMDRQATDQTQIADETDSEQLQIEQNEEEEDWSEEEDDDEFNFEEIVKLDIDERIVELTYDEAVNGSESDHWIAAIKAEFEIFEERRAFEEPLELNTSLNESNYVNSRWVFVKKYDANGEVSRYRARLVARGFNIEVSPAKKYAPTISKSQLRLMLTEAIRNGHHVHQVDVRSAYLYSLLNDEIYLEVPRGYQPRHLPCTILKIKKAMYGLPQSGKLWYDHLKRTLEKLGFQSLKNDEAIFTNGEIRLVLFVDDILVIGELNKIERFKKDFEKVYEIRDGGELNYFLGTEYEIVRNESTYKIGMSNRNKINDLIAKFKQESAKEQTVPCIYQKSQIKKDVADGTMFDEKLISSIVGSLNFIRGASKPDIAFALSIVAGQQSTPSWGVMRQALKILAYLKAHIKEALWLEIIEDEKVESFTDASHEGIFDNGKSRAGHAVYYCGCLIDWSTAKIKKVTKSPGESELLAAVQHTEKVELIEKTLDELGVRRQSTELYVDSKTVIDCVNNPTNKSKMIHRRGEIELMKQYAENREMKKVESKDNRADVMTKPFSPGPFAEAKFNLCIYDNELVQ